MLQSHSRKILVIDTDPNIQSPFAFILEDIGHTMISCIGSDFFEFITVHEPDLVMIIDGPDNAGVKICRSIKDSPYTSYVPVILTSSSSDLQEHAVLCGADSYLPVPFEVDFLKIMTERLLGLRD